VILEGINGYGHTTLNAPLLVSISEVKQRQAQLVVGWETTREPWVLYSSFFFCAEGERGTMERTPPRQPH
jgi:hypothetical protein